MRVQCKVGGEYLLKLNIAPTPIANKYRKGKLQRTLKIELKDLKPPMGKGSRETRHRVHRAGTSRYIVCCVGWFTGPAMGEVIVVSVPLFLGRFTWLRGA